MSPVVYDKNGNIRNLTRKNSSGGNRESLGYTYAGNRLSSISGTYNGIYKSGNFSYDGNGNATRDGLRGLTVTYFDELNLPKQYYQNSTNKVDYTYDAGGTKWSKTATVSGTASTTLYDGTFIYENGTLKKVLTSEGYYDPSAGLYYYYLKDHLGNTRLTFHYSGTTAVVDQEVEYYPFGSLFTENNLDKNKYLYNGKELNDEFFENYDYGARFYDAELGRWHVVDPMAEKYSFQSPYAYAANNPILFIDNMGMEPDIVDEIMKSINQTQGYKVVTNNETQQVTIFRTSAALSKDKVSSNSNANIVVTNSVFQLDDNGEVKDISVTQNAVSATLEDGVIVSTQSEEIDYKGSHSGNIDNLKADYTDNDPVVQGISELSQSANRDALFSQDNSLPGLSLLDRAEKNIGLAMQVIGLAKMRETFGLEYLSPDISKTTRLNIKLNKANSAGKKLRKIARKHSVNKI